MWDKPTAPPDSLEWCIRLPSNGEWTKIVRGALAEILRPINYREGAGLDIEDVTRYAQEIFDSMTLCFALKPGDIFQSYREITDDTALLCDGGTYDKADYPFLSGVLDGKTGSTATTFDVPDLKGRSPVGVGQGSGLTNRALNASGGEETHKLTVSEMPSHRHQTLPLTFALAQLGAGSPTYTTIGSTSPTSYTGGDGSHNNMQPWRGVYFYIVTGN